MRFGISLLIILIIKITIRDQLLVNLSAIWQKAIMKREYKRIFLN